MAITINTNPANRVSTNPFSKRGIADFLMSEILPKGKDGKMVDPTAYYSAENTKTIGDRLVSQGLSESAAQASAQSIYDEGQAISKFYGDPSTLNLAANAGGPGASDWFKLVSTAAGKHPFKTAGAVALGAGNLGGLFDNDKFGGQLGGLALGGLGAKLMGASNPYTAAMLAMGGGELGALFDKLRAKKETEERYNRGY